jgi:hypothetical protein
MNPPNPPVLTRVGDDYRVVWPDAKLQAYVSSPFNDRTDIKGLLTLERLNNTNGDKPAHLHRAGFNFSTLNSRAQLAKIFAERAKDHSAYDGLDWPYILEQLCHKVTDEYLKPQPILDPWASPPQTLSYLIENLLALDAVNVIFGDSGSGKSYIALALGLHVAAGKPFFGRQVIQGPVLYLDFERNFSIFQRRCYRLAEGFGWQKSETPPIHYRQCLHPLTDEIEGVRRQVSEGKYSLVISDSIGYAAGEDPEGANACLRYFGNIKSLKTTNLNIDHVAKAETSNTKTPFGSAYKKASSDMLWHLRNTQEEGDSVIHVSLWDRKESDGPKQRPIGFKITFEEEATLMESEDVRDVPEFEKELSLNARIAGLLRHGPQPSIEAIAQELDLPIDKIPSIKTTIYRNKGKYIKTERGWGLVTNDQE